MGTPPNDPTADRSEHVDRSDHADRSDGTVHPLHLVSRRRFLAGSGAALASAGVVTATGLAQDGATPRASPASTPDATPIATPGATPIGQGMAGMGQAALAPGDAPLTFFTVHEAQTVDALVARILPGSADDPGAHEAGVVDFIDRVLGGTNLGYDLKTYTQGPFLVTDEEPTTVEAASATDIYRTASVNTTDISRYGYQSIMGPQMVYRRGLAFVDGYAQSLFQSDFVGLGADQQDQILSAMFDDTAEGFEGPGGKAFFTQLRNDTIEGMFSDPMYGGNRDMVGWKLIGFPGAQVVYAPGEIQTPGTNRQPQSLMQMMAAAGH